MDKILLLMQLPGFGIKRVKEFLVRNSLILDDDDFFKYLVSKEVSGGVSAYYDIVKRIKENCFNLGVEIIKCNNNNIINYPPILFLKGCRSLLNSNKILGVVGTRSPSADGKKIDKKMVSIAFGSGWTIISGLAKGCDTLAHRECVKRGGRTIAVLPMGYNKTIAPWILESKGLFLSEYPPFTPVKKFRCVNRNRIITGFSKGLYVIESSKTGGTIHSLRFASKNSIPIGFSYGFRGIENFKGQRIRSVLDMSNFLEKII